MASPNLSEVATTSLRNRTKKLADNVSNNTALLMRLKQRGKMRSFSGGRVITEELAFSGPGNFQYLTAA